MKPLKTHLATFRESHHATEVAEVLRAKLLPRRGYVDIIAVEQSVYIAHTCRQTSYEVNFYTAVWIDGYKTAHNNI